MRFDENGPCDNYGAHEDAENEEKYVPHFGTRQCRPGNTRGDAAAVTIDLLFHFCRLLFQSELRTARAVDFESSAFRPDGGAMAKVPLDSPSRQTARQSWHELELRDPTDFGPFVDLLGA